MSLENSARRWFVTASILSALAILALLEGLALSYTGGYFEYPLDDVYIHLAMAQGIGSGGYGINPGEYTSAASSVIYSLFLLPVFPPEMQRFVPFFWNVVGMIISAWLWAELLLAGGYGQGRMRPLGVALAIAGPIALLMSATAFLGMEHTLHAAASLAILLGLVKHLQGQTPWGLLFAGILLSPLLRYEGLALAVLASGVLFITGYRRAGLFGLALSLLPLAAFSGFLMSLGLDPLPNSVVAKQLLATGEGLNVIQRSIAKFRTNILTGGGTILLVFSLVIWGMLATSDRLRAGPYRPLALVIIAAGMGHLFLGQIGWMNRYEHYILVVMAGGFLVLLGSLREQMSQAAIAVVAAIALLIPAIWYLPEVLGDFPVGARAVHHQQGQMSVFAKQHLDAPIAVNDIGWVAWDNPNYVLDLWGLASSESLALRLMDNEPGWAGPLAARYDVPAAMIYDDWLGDAVSPDWVRLGEFVLRERRGFLGSDTVAFYATAPEHVDQVLTALRGWVPGLDPLTYFEYAPGIE